MVDTLSKSDARQIALRSYVLQTLLNFRTMQGPGYLFSLLPALRRGGGRAAELRRAAGFMNSHPVFAAYAQGAILRRLREKSPAGDAEFNSWRESLAGPLGLLGDQLIWDRWKPIVFAAGIIPILLWPSVISWAVTASICLLVYNVPLYRLRVFAVRRGYELGERVLQVLGEPWVGRVRKALNRTGVVVAGLVLGVSLIRSSSGAWPLFAQFAVAFAVMTAGQKLRLTVTLSLLLSLVAAIALGVLL
ncbi:PTS system mannose/fructose/sorbose family transporter subunit IID [candidate division KSB1 bacterium]|nr:PTS system mannose/fructose/sorbose family transporter subunit IID [candidate division KSB1 bacterium]